MKLPSFAYLITNAKKSLVRFPLTIITSIIAVCFGIFLIERGESIKNIFPYINILLTTSIGIPLFFSATIVSNKRKLNQKENIILSFIVTIILVVIYFTLPNAESTHNTALPYIKYAIYNITSHLLVSFIPFVFGSQINGFWNYNKILFTRILTSALYSGFLFVGLALALTSMNLLFEIKIHEQLYFEIFIVIGGLFNTWFFLAGIPEDFDNLDLIVEYPKGLKIFSQYILLSLLVLYLLILYLYGAKILISWDWPKGLVSYLIIFVSILGILTFLLLYPYGNKPGNEWIKKVSKSFYVILIPLLVILFIAILMRIDDYGITIKRYIVLSLGIWLSVVCLYTAIGKTNIKFIPVSLAIMLVFTSFGPWGMFSVSEHYQVTRLEKILEQSKILVGGKIQNENIWTNENLVVNDSSENSNEFKNEGRMSDSLHNEVRSILNYLDDFHGFSAIQKWFKQDIDSIVDAHISKKNNSDWFSEPGIYMKSMGLNYSYMNTDTSNENINYTSNHYDDIIKVTGYDYIVDFDKYIYSYDEYEVCSFNLDSIEYKMNFNTKLKNNLLLETKTESIPLKLNEIVTNLIKEYGNNSTDKIPVQKMQVFLSAQKFDFKIEFYSLGLSDDDKDFKINELRGRVFIKMKNGMK